MASTETVIPAFILPLLNTIATQEGFQDYIFSCSPGASEGDGLLGIINRITIKELRHKKSRDELALILKTPPSNEPEDEIFFTELIFEREIFAYTEFLPAIVEFQNQKGISLNKGFFSFPKMYGTILDTNKHFYGILLEDLQAKSFKLFNSAETRSTDIDHAIIVVKELAKLHGISFALNDQNPEIFNRFKKVEEPLVKELTIANTIKFKNVAFDRAINCLCPVKNKEAIEKMQILKESYVEQILSCVSEPTSKFVINHGDCWINNAMFRYEQVHKKFQNFLSFRFSFIFFLCYRLC